ncbi:MAG: DUF1080 domain-containing protein [Planctomycetota bacterium]|nr:DUF1080 domain-containing protein [Planctomycetales bacterium]MEE3285342.1 DUF1080 domain-containing protein [Planctomycetota bacterium]
MLPRITTLLLVAAALLLTPFAGSAEDKDGWISLFNGKNFDGWKIGDAKQGKWKIENGNIVANGPRSHLYTIKEFKNFEFKAEVMTTPGSNSGIYFHTKYQETGFPNTGYESQVNVSHGDPVKTGSLWGVVKLYETPAKDNKWWEQHIIVRGQNIVVKINGKTVLDYTEPKGVQGGRKISSGSFALQAHDPKSVIYYRNLRVKPLK